LNSPASQHLAFVGLGIMGLPMAQRLQAAGHSLTVHTRTKSRAASILQQGATWADTPAAAAAQADVCFICVTDTPDVQAVINGPSGIAAGGRPDLIVVDHSTISPSATREMAKNLAGRGITLLDAPVSGGDVGARDGTLSIMVGGDPAAFEKMLPLLRHMGQTITHCGPSGNGQLTKLVNQILVSVTCMAVAEALAFAKKNGLDAEKTMAAVGGGAGSSWQLSRLGPKMLAGDFRPGFMVDLLQKDLRLIHEAAAQSKSALPATRLVHQLLTMAQQQNHGRDGTQSLFAVIEKMASASLIPTSAAPRD
jgi:3-hydroxyisobutyrate dehydrogenase